jgi:hypothetical protein
VLGATTEDGDQFLSDLKYIPAKHARHVVLALCGGFQENVIVAFDSAPCVRASAVTDSAARDDVEFVRLPAYSPELNLVEECWRQVKTDLSARFFGPLWELTTAIDDALDQSLIPSVGNNFQILLCQLVLREFER